MLREQNPSCVSALKTSLLWLPILLKLKTKGIKRFCGKENVDDECLVIFVNIVGEIEEVGPAFSSYNPFPS